MTAFELPGNAVMALRNSLNNTTTKDKPCVDSVANNFSSLIYVNIVFANRNPQNRSSNKALENINTLFLITSNVPLPDPRCQDNATFLRCAKRYYTPRGLQKFVMLSSVMENTIRNMKIKVAKAKLKANFINRILSSTDNYDENRFIMNENVLDAYINLEVEPIKERNSPTKYKIKDIQVRINNMTYHVDVHELGKILNRQKSWMISLNESLEKISFSNESSELSDEKNKSTFNPLFIVKGIFLEDLLVNIPNIKSSLVLDSLIHFYCLLFSVVLNPTKVFSENENPKVNNELAVEEIASSMLPGVWLTAHLMGFPLFCPLAIQPNGSLRFLNRKGIDIKKRGKGKPIVIFSDVQLPDSHFRAYMMDLSANKHTLFCPNALNKKIKHVPKQPEEDTTPRILWPLVEKLAGMQNEKNSYINTIKPSATTKKNESLIQNNEKSNKPKKRLKLI